MPEKKEPWLDYLALTTVVLAVCATLATFKGGGYSTKSVLYQTKASDQWAYYQAKSLKGYLYELQKDKLQLELKILRAKASLPVRDEYESKIAEYSKKIKKYEEERNTIQNEAKKLETARDDAQKHAQTFGIAVIFLQIAILLSSIAALMKKKYLWVLGMAVGACGIVYFVNGFLLFM
jgi:DNA repair exonuclease SbcCD ATPase subunit